MLKLGDRWEWGDTAYGSQFSVHKFNILISDLDFLQQGFQTWGSHPDKDGVMQPELLQDQKMQNELFTPVAVSVNQFALSRWVNTTTSIRGSIDMNFAADDGSVKRITEIPYAATLVGYQDSDRLRGVPWNSSGSAGYGDAARTLAPSLD